jgi:hypothetical protein
VQPSGCDQQPQSSQLRTLDEDGSLQGIGRLPRPRSAYVCPLDNGGLRGVRLGFIASLFPHSLWSLAYSGHVGSHFAPLFFFCNLSPYSSRFGCHSLPVTLRDWGRGYRGCGGCRCEVLRWSFVFFLCPAFRAFSVLCSRLRTASLFPHVLLLFILSLPPRLSLGSLISCSFFFSVTAKSSLMPSFKCESNA